MISEAFPRPQLSPCDACGAAGYVQVDSGLTFCAHHARIHLPKLFDLGQSVTNDQRLTLLVR